MSTIDKIKAAKSKDALEKIAQEEFNHDVDKRRGLETIRADVLLMAEGSETQAQEPAQDPEAQAAQGETQGETQGTDQEPQEQAPEAQDKGPKYLTDEQKRQQRRAEALERRAALAEKRRLKNTKNGRVFVWTAALAQKAGMVEVTEEE